MKCEVRTILFLHEGSLPLSETPYPSFGLTGYISILVTNRTAELDGYGVKPGRWGRHLEDGEQRGPGVMVGI